jgi:hypothetical protein
MKHPELDDLDPEVMEKIDDMLNSNGEVKIAGVTFDRSEILKSMDPGAYREMYSLLESIE